ncbi:hypothetical protein A2886_03320 [candidate division WWE3 bacterium RIFCSPHIGHO2_01_FULL_42_13]|uniref:Uncharacterized protein n=1 Tax=candidate division WWE3 bacterium RIFCSPHIGHO2_01_FULL_42_13 TaxID=1802617 RepID=A0A1F4USI3_UNCKA|nr:MAG: hypothetical protein A2886_03320 [candidate division WWE3 bacterium RIFCSPHIGHO2_01_FULL_42_13]
MPKFLYTVLVFAALLWWALLRILVGKAPDNAWVILLFLLVLLITLTLTLSLPLYLLFHKRAPEFANLRFLYRKSLKWSVLLGFFVTGILGLRAFNLGSTLNIILFSLLCVVLGFQLGKSR